MINENNPPSNAESKTTVGTAAAIKRNQVPNRPRNNQPGQPKPMVSAGQQRAVGQGIKRREYASNNELYDAAKTTG